MLNLTSSTKVSLSANLIKIKLKIIHKSHLKKNKILHIKHRINSFNSKIFKNNHNFLNCKKLNIFINPRFL